MRLTALLLLLHPHVIHARAGAFQVPSSWRDVMEDANTTQLFFDIYALCVSSTSANASVALEVLFPI